LLEWKREEGSMFQQIVVVTQLADVEGVLGKIRENYRPEIFSIHVKAYQIDNQFSLPRRKGFEDIDLDDYRDIPLCRIEVGVTDLARSYEALLSLLRGVYVIIDAFHGPLLAPTLETSLEVQQKHWKILEYHVLDEERCLWIAKAKRVHLFPSPGRNQSEPVQTLLVTGWQCLAIDEDIAKTLFQFT